MKLPEWLAERRVADEYFAGAYDKTTAPARAALKTGIAMAYEYYGLQPACQKRSLLHANSGLAITLESKPADWAIISIAKDYAFGAAPIVAAAILPLLSGVTNVFASVEQIPGMEVLISFEMCGIRDLFMLDSANLANAICELAKNAPNGRIVHLSACADEHKASPDPRILATRPQWGGVLADSEAFDTEILKFCYGELLHFNAAACTGWQCILAPARAATPPAQLRLAPGCEGFWLYNNLAPDFFSNRCASLEKKELTS